ncbi:hypothetical protein MRX96_003570 [Rhipicephalus microplus]
MAARPALDQSQRSGVCKGGGNRPWEATNRSASASQARSKRRTSSRCPGQFQLQGRSEATERVSRVPRDRRKKGELDQQVSRGANPWKPIPHPSYTLSTS